jgi:hypothetical protein
MAEQKKACKLSEAPQSAQAEIDKLVAQMGQVLANHNLEAVFLPDGGTLKAAVAAPPDNPTT